MIDENQARSRAQADNESIAIGSLSIGGDVSGRIAIGHTIGYTSEQVSVLIDQIKTTFQPKRFDGRSPYKGLDVFEEEDAGLFFGREKAVADLVTRVKASRAVFITGPSGSGKSSLVRAGLFPALKQGGLQGSQGWSYETVKPGRDPLEALALAFSRLKSPELGKYFRENARQPNVLHECAESALSGQEGQRLVLFIDQFEEIFTQVGDEEKRAAFLALLTQAATVEGGRVILLFAMRSDFISNCASYPRLNALLNEQFVQIGAMQPDELVSAIAQPALRVGLRIDPDLVAQIINDMQGEPGALPLMQFALKDLFDTQQARDGLIALTREAYFQRGGIQKSLERHADASFAQLSAREQELARSIFGGLIEVGHGTQDTRRTALFDELVPASSNAEEVGAILRKLADARLVTTDQQAGQDMVTISHEKLIEAWPWLKKLVDENREAIALQNQIATDAKEWKDKKRDPSYLYAGARLANAREQLAARKLALSGLAQEFVQIGSRRQRRARLALVASLSTVFALLAFAAVLFSRQASANAGLAQANIEIANTAQAGSTQIARQRDEAQKQAQAALARQLAAQANAVQDQFPVRSLLLSVEALNVTRAAGLADQPAVIDGLIRQLMQVDGLPLGGWSRMSMDGKWLAVTDPGGQISLLNLAQEDPLETKTRLAERGRIRFSPDGQKAALSQEGGALLVWDLSGETIAGPDLELQGPPEGFLVTAREPFTFDPGGRWLAGLDAAKTLWVWDLERPASNLSLRAPHAQVDGFLFSPDQRWLLTWGVAAPEDGPGEAGNIAALWSLEALAGEDLSGYIVLPEHQAGLDYGFSLDGMWLFTKASSAPSDQFLQTFWDLSELDPGALAAPTATLLQAGQPRVTGFGAGNAWTYHVNTGGPGGQSATTFAQAEGFPDQSVIWTSLGFWQVVIMDPSGRLAAVHGRSTRDPNSEEGRFNLLDFSGLSSPFASNLYFGLIGIDSQLFQVTPAQKPDIINAVAFSQGSGTYLAATLAETAEIYVWSSRLGFDNPPIKFLGAEPERFRTQLDAPDWRPPLSTGNLAVSDAGWLAAGGRLYNIQEMEYGRHPFFSSSYPGSLPTTGFLVKSSPGNRWLLTWYPPYVGNTNKQARLAAAQPERWGFHLWDLNSMAYRSLPYPHHFIEMADDPLVFSPDEGWFAIGHETEVHLWNLAGFASGEAPLEPVVLTGAGERISALAFSADGRWLAASSWDGKVRLWALRQDGPSGEALTLAGAPPLGPLAVSPDSRWLLAGGDDGTIFAWDLRNISAGTKAPSLHHQEGPVFNLQFSPDGQYFAAGTYDNVLLYRVASDGIEPEPIELEIVSREAGEGAGGERIDAVAFSPDSKWLVAKNRLWKLEDLQADPDAPAVDLGYSYISEVRISPDARWLVVKPATFFDFGRSFPFPPFAGGGGGYANPPLYDTVELWDLGATQPAAEWKPIVIPASGVTSFSPDGRWLAVGTAANAQLIDLFSLAQEEAIQPIVLPDAFGYLAHVTFTPNGNNMLSGPDMVETYLRGTSMIPQVMYRWDLDFVGLSSQACQLAGRNLSREEWAQYFINRPYHLTCPQWQGDE